MEAQLRKTYNKRLAMAPAIMGGTILFHFLATPRSAIGNDKNKNKMVVTGCAITGSETGGKEGATSSASSTKT